MLKYLLIVSVMLVQHASGADANRLTPVLAKPGKVHLEMDFENYNLGITATNRGTICIDNLTIWHAGAVQDSWEETKKKLVKRTKP